LGPFPFTDSGWLLNISSAGQDRFMDQLYFAELARASRCQPQVDKERSRVWRRWLAYLANIGKATDPFLELLDSSDQHASLKPVILGGFAQAL
jgi:hypothetical protein